jgi:TPR repeat protein
VLHPFEPKVQHWRHDIVINASNITALEQAGVGNRARVDGGGCSNLGLSYEKGKGVKQDDFKALTFFIVVSSIF